jgi:hypothetical protein
MLFTSGAAKVVVRCLRFGRPHSLQGWDDRTLTLMLNSLTKTATGKVQKIQRRASHAHHYDEEPVA